MGGARTKKPPPLQRRGLGVVARREATRSTACTTPLRLVGKAAKSRGPPLKRRAEDVSSRLRHFRDRLIADQEIKRP
jgi:hypothetical protein